MKRKTIQLTLTSLEYAFIHESMMDSIYNRRRLYRNDALIEACSQIRSQLFSTPSLVPKKKKIIKKFKCKK